MPRRKGKPDKTEVPDTIQRSGKEAKKLWLKAHDSAVKTYGEGSAAHRVAFAALKHVYEKKGDKWVNKAEKDPQAARGPTTRRKSTDEPKAPTAGGKVARTAKEARQKAREARREDREARAKRASRSKSLRKTTTKKSTKKSTAKKSSARKKASR